jgi:hypothetical protein
VTQRANFADLTGKSFESITERVSFVTLRRVRLAILPVRRAASRSAWLSQRYALKKPDDEPIAEKARR